jgi:tRNA pseudouridine32 synthase / 23S rRNA pseudouridine746 synthase
LARTSFLVHRLDREAEGLMLIAHQRRAADAFSKLWQQQQISKRYEVMVSGAIGTIGSTRRIDAPLDGKNSITEFTVRSFDEERRRSVLDVTLITGRKHQIRRHLAGAGHPVVGDYRYGARDIGATLALRAIALAFRCPLRGRECNYRIDNAF